VSEEPEILMNRQIPKTVVKPTSIQEMVK